MKGWCYVTAAAVHQWGLLTRVDTHADSGFAQCEDQLIAICADARRVDTQCTPNTDLYRAKARVAGQTWTVELTVALGERPEGHLPQLVRVRSKRRGGHIRNRRDA
jgi:hypothetical protein